MNTQTTRTGRQLRNRGNPEVSTLAFLALALSAASAACAWTVNIALYRLWTLVPTDVFPGYQAAHEVRFVPLAALFGIPNLMVAVLVARRGLPGLRRWPLWAGAVLALLPWVVTPAYFIPLQGRLRLAGPTPELVSQLVTTDAVLRAVPVTLQHGIVLWALIATMYRMSRSELHGGLTRADNSRSGQVG
jgi:hypothetical protein